MKLADFAESARALFKRLTRMRANKSSKSAESSASSHASPLSRWQKRANAQRPSSSMSKPVPVSFVARFA